MPEAIAIAKPHELPLKIRIARWLGHQPWIPRGRTRLMDLFHKPSTALDIDFETPFFSTRYRGNLRQLLDCMVLLYGAYEWPVLEVMRSAAAHLKAERGTVAYVDVGGNLGHHVLFMAPLADSVFTFEPFPPLQAQIQDKIDLNGLTNVRIFPVGLGAADEVLAYHPGAGTNSGAGSFLDSSRDAAETGTPLQIRIGDDLFAAEQLPPIGLLKVDVEGFEGPVFEGLKTRILTDRPIIITELGERSRRLIKDEAAFRALFYPGAHVFEIAGREGQPTYRLLPFNFNNAIEVNLVIAPFDPRQM